MAKIPLWECKKLTFDDNPLPELADVVNKPPPLLPICVPPDELFVKGFWLLLKGVGNDFVVDEKRLVELCCTLAADTFSCCWGEENNPPLVLLVLLLENILPGVLNKPWLAGWLPLENNPPPILLLWDPNTALFAWLTKGFWDDVLEPNNPPVVVAELPPDPNNEVDDFWVENNPLDWLGATKLLDSFWPNNPLDWSCGFVDVPNKLFVEGEVEKRFPDCDWPELAALISSSYNNFKRDKQICHGKKFA